MSNVRACSPQCPWCAKEFWNWLKSRNHQMSRVLPGQSVSFQEAANTSVKPPKDKK